MSRTTLWCCDIVSVLKIKKQGVEGLHKLLKSRQLVPEGARNQAGEILPGEKRSRKAGHLERGGGLAEGQPRDKGRMGQGRAEEGP